MGAPVAAGEIALKLTSVFGPSISTDPTIEFSKMPTTPLFPDDPCPVATTELPLITLRIVLVPLWRIPAVKSLSPLIKTSTLSRVTVAKEAVTSIHLSPDPTPAVPAVPRPVQSMIMSFKGVPSALSVMAAASGRVLPLGSLALGSPLVILNPCSLLPLSRIKRLPFNLSSKLTPASGTIVMDPIGKLLLWMVSLEPETVSSPLRMILTITSVPPPRIAAARTRGDCIAVATVLNA